MAYNDEQLRQIISGGRGGVHYKLLLHQSDISGTKGPRLEGVENISIKRSNYNDWSWELNCTVTNNRAFNPLTNYVKAYLYIRAGGDENYSSYPMGLYRFSSPTGTHSMVTTWELTGYSLEWLALGDTSPKGFKVSKNQQLLATAKLILQTMVPPIPASRINFPVESVPLVARKDIFFDPIQDPENVRKLRIINTILNAAGFNSLYTDADGKPSTSKIEDFRKADVDAFYTTLDNAWLNHRGQVVQGQQIIKTDEITDEFDEENFANRVVVQSGEANEKVPIIWVEENLDPDDPTSITSLQRVKQLDPIVLQSIVSESEARLVALEALARAAGRYRVVTFATPPDPRRVGHKEHFWMRVRLAKGNQPIGGKWRVIEWELSDDGMNFTVARLEVDDQAGWREGDLATV